MLAAVALLFATLPCGAHSLVVPEGVLATAVVEILVESGEIRVEIMATVPDLLPFSDVFPDEFRVRMGLQSEPGDLRHQRFFTGNFVIRADGRPVAGRVESFETRNLEGRDELTGASIPLRKGNVPLTVPVVALDLRYELDSRPETLTITPPTFEDGELSSSIGIVTTHLGLPVTDFHPFTDEETLVLDWDDPWNSVNRNPDLRRRDASPMGVFLHVEPTEIRVEVVARPVDLQSVEDLGVEGLETIPVDIQDAVKAAGAELLAASFELKIDGERVGPILEDIRFLERRLRGSPAAAPAVDLHAGAVVFDGVFTYRVTGYPGEVALSWELFPERVGKIEAAVIDVTGSRVVELDTDHRVLKWENTLEDPWIPTLVNVPAPASPELNRLMWASWIVLTAAVAWLLRAGPRAAGGGGPWWLAVVLALAVVGLAFGSWTTTRAVLVNEERASEIIGALLHNVYHAFDYSDEREIRRILEESVTAEAVDSCLEIGGWLELRDCEGPRAGIRRVELVDLKMSETEDVIDARCMWVVTAAVGHLDHRHLETGRVVADLRIEPFEGTWRISGLEPVQDSRH